jgi:hypothetical protein
MMKVTKRTSPKGQAMKTITAVALRTAADLPMELLTAQLMKPPNGAVAVVHCSAVQEAFYGFLQLTLIAKEEKTRPLELVVPLDTVAWMLRGEPGATIGFLPAQPAT